MVQFYTMGQTSSLPKPGRRKSLRSWGRKAPQNGNLSHTFAIPEGQADDERVELVNINQASEEELMTLPGVNRETARSIVEHRKAIGRFRRVEDLALVRGVGADRLENLRGEVCVANRRNFTWGTASRAQSYDSLKSADSRQTVRSGKILNVNKASVFDLQCVYGITQEIAAAIVLYREKKGLFKQVDDLLKVKQIDRFRLDNISRFLTVNEDSEDTEITPRSSVLSNGFCTPSITSNGPLKIPQLNGLSASSLVDIFELLSAYSPRPIVEEVFHQRRNGEPAIRVASWNLQELSVEKANNPGVREVVCRTILENGLSIIAVQGVIHVTALKIICDELNKPKLRRISEWKDKNHNWNFCMLDIEDSHLGFIYDSEGAIDIDIMSLTQGPEDIEQDCEVLIASFKIADFNLQLVNLKINKLAKIENLTKKIKDLVSDQDMLLVLTDFSSISHMTDSWLKIGNLEPSFTLMTNTNFLSTKLNLAPQHISNILYNVKIREQLTGVNGVIRQGLTHLAIPNGWNWGGPVSIFCPIWTELFLNFNTGTAL